MAMILLVRHGENEWVREHRLAGWIEGVHLNENGKKQAADAAERLSHLPIKAIYTSPVKRCVETATYLAQPHQLELIELPAVGEVRYGDWEGAKIAELAKLPEWKTVQHYPSRMRFPEGEALREVQFRAIQAVEELAQNHKEEMIVVCSHADLIKLVLAHYLGVHTDLFQRIIVSPASISVLMLMDNGGVRVARINDTGPLTAPTPSKSKNEHNEGKQSAESVTTSSSPDSKKDS